MNFRSKKWTVVLLVFLIVLSVGVFVKVAYDTNVFGSDFRSLVMGTFQKNPFKKQSEVKVSLIDSKINLDFDLIEEDKAKFGSFVRNWFEVSEEINNLSFGIDENMKNILSQNLPVTLKLTITDKSAGFNSNMVPGLQNALVKSNFEFATGSSKLDVEYSDSSKYQLKIENPADLAFYATSSGILTASSKLERLFKTLPKVATIELNVNGKNVSGQIMLK